MSAANAKIEPKLNSVVGHLREILSWLDTHEYRLAAIHVNQAIEELDPPPMALFEDQIEN